SHLLGSHATNAIRSWAAPPSPSITYRSRVRRRPKGRYQEGQDSHRRDREGKRRALSEPAADMADWENSRRMSACGTKRTFPGSVPMSAFGGKADIAQTCVNVRFWG